MNEVYVRVLIAFNGLRRGDTAWAPDTPVLRGYVRTGLMEVLDDGKRPVGQSRPEESDPRGVPEGTAGSVPAGGQPGKNPRSRRHRKAPGVDPGGSATPADAPPVGESGD